MKVNKIFNQSKLECHREISIVIKEGESPKILMNEILSTICIPTPIHKYVKLQQEPMWLAMFVCMYIYAFRQNRFQDFVLTGEARLVLGSRLQVYRYKDTSVQLIIC